MYMVSYDQIHIYTCTYIYIHIPRERDTIYAVYIERTIY